MLYKWDYSRSTRWILTPPHTHFILPSSVFICGEKEDLAFGVYISITFLFCFSFELMCSHFGRSKETYVEPFSGSAASNISLTFEDIPFPSSVFYPHHTHSKRSLFLYPHLSLPQQPRTLVTPQMLGSAIFIFFTVRVCVLKSLALT